MKNNNLTQHGCKLNFELLNKLTFSRVATSFNSQQPCFWLFKVRHFSMQIHSQTRLQLDAPRCCPPPGHMPQPHVPRLHGHVAAPPRTFMATLLPPSSCTATSLPPLQPCLLHRRMLSCTATVQPPSQLHTSPPLCHLHGPCCSTPRSGMHYAAAPIAATHTMSPPSQPHSVATCLAAVWATSAPPSQPGTPCCCMPCSWMGHIGASLVAAYAALPHTLQLHRPFATSLTAAHAPLPCAS
jgi:hypothetical protein